MTLSVREMALNKIGVNQYSQGTYTLAERWTVSVRIDI